MLAVPSPSKTKEFLAAKSRRYRAENKERVRGYELKKQAADPVKEWCRKAHIRLRWKSGSEGHQFDLTAEYLQSIASPDCPALGMPLNYAGNTGKGPKANGPSVDKKVPSLGYVQGNVVIISILANRIKQDASSVEVGSVAAWMRSEGL